ncbi:hypothetical protein ACFPT0_01540 [Acinetobacter portensis]|nr:hypothetical protein [Acinetobacter portensis]
MSFSCVTFAGQSKQNNCVATGVPSKGCICWPDGVCVDVGDIGTHP